MTRLRFALSRLIMKLADRSRRKSRRPHPLPLRDARRRRRAGALETMLKPLGFSVERPVFSEDGTPDIENLYARPLRQRAASDVCRPYRRRAGRRRGRMDASALLCRDPKGEMYGRGAVDMKGGIACFIAAVARHLEPRAASRARSRC